MRRLAILAAAVAMLAAPALAQGPYKLDAKGGCHRADGKYAAKAMCAAPGGPYKLDAKGGCHRADGKYAAKAMCMAH